MRTDNLTPDKNPNERIYFTDEDDSIVGFVDPMHEKEFTSTKCILAFLLLCILVLTAIASVFILIFKY